MKKLKSVNVSFLILVVLFILSQATFALTGVLTPGSANDKKLVSFAPVNQTIDQQIADVNVAQNAEENNSQVQTFAAVEAADSTQEALSQPQSTLVSPAEAAVSQPEATPAPQEIKSVVRYVNADSLNVRSEPTSESQLVASIKRGDKVTYYETQGQWAKIITWKDQKGYILAKYLVDSEKQVEKIVEEKLVASASTETKTVSRQAETSEPASAEAQSLAEKIISYAKTLQGVKYVYGGYSSKGLDCSGFTKYVFAKYGVSLPRSSEDYSGIGTKVSRSDLRAGDILLFDGWGNSTLNHVGLYIGGGNFIHASTTKGKVVVQNLASYRGKYLGARRVID